MKSLPMLAALAMMSLGSVAKADPYTDDLSKCLVSSATDSDRALLTQWMFALFSLPNDVSKFTTLTPEDRDAIDTKVADLFMRLTTESCKTQLHDAYQYEGITAITSSFEVLGKVASMGLMQDPAVVAGMGGFAKHLDQSKLEAAMGKKPEPSH